MIGVGPDLGRAQRDVGYFAKLCKHPMTERQLGALRFETLVTALLCPRQSGKSHALALGAVWWAVRRRDQRVLIISGGETAAVRLMDMVRGLVAASPLLGAESVVRETSRRIDLSNGSAIECVPTSEYQARSATTDLLLFDEAGLIPQSIVSAAEPTLAAREGGRIMYAGTPWALDSPFHRVVQLGDRGSDSVRVVRWTLEEAPRVNWELVEYHRETMPDAVYRAEYEGTWGGDSDALFSRAELDFASADYRLADVSRLRPAVGVLGGVDWGRRFDQTALVVLGRLPVWALNPDRDLGPVFGVVAVHVWPRGTSTVESVEQLLSWSAWWHCLSYEDNGIGTGPADMIDARFSDVLDRVQSERGGAMVEEPLLLTPGGRPGRTWDAPSSRWEGPPRLARGICRRVTTTAPLKAGSLGWLKTGMRNGQIVAPREGSLLRQLNGLRIEFRPSGTTSIQAEDANVHDDLADAFWIARGLVGVGALSWPGWPRRTFPTLTCRARLTSWRRAAGWSCRVIRCGSAWRRRS